MTVSKTDNSIIHDADGSSTDFTFGFRFFEDADIKVFLTDTDGSSAEEQTQGTDYTLDANTNKEGGTVKFTSAPADSKQVRILRWVDPTQDTDLTEGGELPAESIEEALDKVTILAQQVMDKVGGGVFELESFGTIQFLAGDLSVWDADSKRMTNIATPTASADAATKKYVDDKTAAAGNVPSPSSGDVGLFLKAIGVDDFDWRSASSAGVPTPTTGDDDKTLRVNDAEDGYELITASVQRTNLGLGTSAVEDVGTAVGNVTQLESVGGSAGMPAVDGSQLTGIEGATREKLATKTPSGVATAEFTTNIDSTFSVYEFLLELINPSDDGITLEVQFSTDGGATWITDASAYGFAFFANSGPTGSGTSSTADSGNEAIDLTQSNVDGVEGDVCGSIRMYTPANANSRTRLSYQTAYSRDNDHPAGVAGMGSDRTKRAINAVRFKFSTGNIDSGTITLFGVK